MEITEFDLQKPVDPDFEPPRRSVWIWVVAGIVVVVLVAAYFMVWRRPAPAQDRVAVSDVAPAPPPAPVREPTPLGGVGDPIDLPPLDETDAIVRELVRKLSTHPSVLAWLATDNLLRHFTAGIQNIAAGRSPATHAQRLAPTSPFRAAEGQGAITIDPRSYQRYDAFASAVDSIDPAGAARLYATLRPRIDEAYAELGADARFDAVLERAFYVLLQTPIVDGRVALEIKGVNYVYTDPRLERLTPAQKHLLRMGPRNMRVIQSKLRQIALALGIPAERLPEVQPAHS